LESLEEETLGRPRRRWKDNIEMDLKEIVWNWIHYVSVAGSCEHHNKPSGSIRTREFLDWLSDC
jgi:hypothetical protein